MHSQQTIKFKLGSFAHLQHQSPEQPETKKMEKLIGPFLPQKNENSMSSLSSIATPPMIVKQKAAPSLKPLDVLALRKEITEKSIAEKKDA